ncbi:patatin-like phospholipase family protein [Bacillus sp. OVS6]|nr:patatin-like phospholipase family protein [Bacillus sp. OVS6]
MLSNIKRVGGSSAGAIVALILSLNYSQSKLSKILSNLNLLDFKDESFGPIGDIVRLTNEFGWYKGDKFKEWIEDIIEEKTGNKHSTFKDINEQKEEYNFKDLYILGTNLSTHFTEIFSYEHTPNMKISEAVRISMSIPLFLNL